MCHYHDLSQEGLGLGFQVSKKLKIKKFKKTPKKTDKKQMQQSVYLFAPQRLESGFVHVLLLLFWARSISAFNVKGLHSRQPLLLIPAAAPLWHFPMLTLLAEMLTQQLCTSFLCGLAGQIAAEGCFANQCMCAN